MIIQNTFANNFGIIIPMKTGVKFQQQTGGVCCNQIYIEGVFLPLDYPREYDKKTEKIIELFGPLNKANYGGREKEAVEIWKRIDKTLFFEYVKIKEPKGQPWEQEGLMWIKITKIKKNIGGRRLDKWCYNRCLREYKGLIGKKVALIYPNCD